MEHLVEDMQQIKDYVEKIRYGQERVFSTHSACRSKDREYVSYDQFRRTKERINHAFSEYNKLFEEFMRRDHVIAESLLETQKGRNKRLVCTENCHNTLLGFI